jgi:hypothetical protein
MVNYAVFTREVNYINFLIYRQHNKISPRKRGDICFSKSLEALLHFLCMRSLIMAVMFLMGIMRSFLVFL